MSGRISLRAGFNRWRQIRAFLVMLCVMPVLVFLAVALIGSKLGAMGNPHNGGFLVVLVITTLLPAIASLSFLRRAFRTGDALRIDDDGLYLRNVGRTIPWPDIRKLSGKRVASSDGSVSAYAVLYADETAEKETQINVTDLAVDRRRLQSALEDRLGPLTG